MSGEKSGKSQGILRWMISGSPEVVYYDILRQGFPCQNRPRNLDLSHKMDLSMWLDNKTSCSNVRIITVIPENILISKVIRINYVYRSHL